MRMTRLTQKSIADWFAARDWSPFPFQREVWKHMAAGCSGLLHASTGSGKTLAVGLGALCVDDVLRSGRTRILWITPMRALAADTARALGETFADLVPGARVGLLTGDTPTAQRAAIEKTPPLVLVTTPESLTLMMAKKNADDVLSGFCVLIVDEWHELIGNKRGVQLQLALARIRRLNPQLLTWGLSATLGNLEQSMDVLLHACPRPRELVQGKVPKKIVIDTLIPASVDRFPWAGHLGLKQLDALVDKLDRVSTALVFTNTRSQAEIWYQALLQARPDWAGLMALHHGSLDKEIRAWVEQGLKEGSLKIVVCTSSLDLGVDFLPVECVVQIGSPKGVARLLQRAGRSGHAPGRVSQVTIVPTHAWELVEAAAARHAALNRAIESRHSPQLATDCLVQHLVTIALGTGFTPDALYAEVQGAWAYRSLTREGFDWVVAFVEGGGASLKAYPDFHRIAKDEAGVYRVPRADIARRHRMSVGTIVSDASMSVAWMTGGRIGSIEESFIARLKPGDCFTFAGRVLELVRVRDMTAWVRKAPRGKGAVPQWQGGKMPLSSELARSCLQLLQTAQTPAGLKDPEFKAIRPLLNVQAAWSAVPSADTLVIETLRSREGFHLFVYAFAGRTVNLGLASLLAWRKARNAPGTFSMSVNDYGFELLSAQDPGWAAHLHAGDALFSEDNLLDDVLGSLNAGELAQRRFREIARIAGLVFTGYPGAGKSTKQLQASSGLFYDVFDQYDPDNALLLQARREAMEQELEIGRLRECLAGIRTLQWKSVTIQRPTPLAFPLMVDRLREKLSTESLNDRVARMVAELEKAVELG